MGNLAANLSHLNATSAGAVISCAQLELEAGGLVSELCSVRFAFKSIGLTLNEFVALKVIAMTSIMANPTNGAVGAAAQQPPLELADRNAVLRIRDRYLRALVSHLAHKKLPLGSGSCSTTALANGAATNDANSGQLGPNTTHVLLRINSLLQCLTRVTSAANLLLASKMFYVPFLMNSSSVTQAAAAAAAVNGNHYHLSHLQHLNQLHQFANAAASVNGGGSGASVALVVANGVGGGSTGSTANSPMSSSNSSASSVASTLSSRSPSTSPPSSVALSGGGAVVTAHGGSGSTSVVVAASSGAAGGQPILAGTGSNCI